MNYQKYADKAYSKIKQYGSPITVKRAGKKTYDPATNTYTDSGTELSGYAIQRNFNQKDIDGTNVKFGDVLFMACLNDRPMTNDSITYKGHTYTVINVSPMNPDGNTDIFINIHAR